MFFLTLVLFVCLMNAYLGAARTLTRTFGRRTTHPVDLMLTDEQNSEKEIFYQQKNGVSAFDSLLNSPNFSEPVVDTSFPDRVVGGLSDDIYCEKIQQQVNSLAKTSPFTFYINHTTIKQKPKLE